MTTDHPQYSTNRRAPRREFAPTNNDGVALTERDIINRIRALAAKQSTQFVSINKLRISLGLSTEDDRSWLCVTLIHMDSAGRVLLSPLERPQDLDIVSAAWFATNASGIRCHEIAAMPQAESRITDHASPTPRIDFVRAAADGLQMLYMRKQGLAPLLAKAAKQSRTFRPTPAPMPQPSAMEVA